MSEVMEVLDEQRCLEYLHSANIGRVAFRVGNEVEILPVNYAWDGSIVVYRTAAGSRLELAPYARVSFEVDGWDPERRQGWSVVLKGVAQDVTAGRDPYSETLRERHVVPLAPGRRERWIAIYPSRVTGRRFDATRWAAAAQPAR